MSDKSGLDASEFARRWKMTEAKAEKFLRAFEDAGLAEQLPDGRWAATEKAREDQGLLAFAQAEPVVKPRRATARPQRVNERAA